MPRHAAAISFAATVALAVPAGWRALDADIRADGKHVRPLQQSVEIDGARVTLDVDRSVIVTGDSLVATLRAYGDAGKKIAVDVVALQSDTTAFSRMQPPPIALDREHIELAAAPGGGPTKTTRIQLGKHTSQRGVRGSFKIVAVAGGTKSKFADDEWPSAIAAVGILGFSSSELGLSIETEGAVRAGAPFTVAVRITNTTKQALRMPFLRVGTGVTLGGYIDEHETEAIAPADGEPDDHSYDLHDAPFKPGATVVRRFTLPAPLADAKQIAIVADTSAGLPQTPDDKYDEMMGWPSFDALDVRTFAIEPAANPSVAEK